MKKPDYIARIMRIDQLIRLEATGAPDDLAQRLQVSRSTLLSFIKHLKEDLSFPIDFCRRKNSYYYSEKGHFRFGFERNQLDAEASSKIKGGNTETGNIGGWPVYWGAAHPNSAPLPAPTPKKSILNFFFWG